MVVARPMCAQVSCLSRGRGRKPEPGSVRVRSGPARPTFGMVDASARSKDWPREVAWPASPTWGDSRARTCDLVADEALPTRAINMGHELPFSMLVGIAIVGDRPWSRFQLAIMCH